MHAIAEYWGTLEGVKDRGFKHDYDPTHCHELARRFVDSLAKKTHITMSQKLKLRTSFMLAYQIEVMRYPE